MAHYEMHSKNNLLQRITIKTAKIKNRTRFNTVQNDAIIIKLPTVYYTINNAVLGRLQILLKATQ